jgi:8-oxo-dGTP pyrophosphatase MutT (NUDIX family)
VLHGVFKEMKERVRNTLREIQSRSLSTGFTRQAAVLIPIFDYEQESHFLLTRRTDQVKTHKGQISFPGGMRQGEEELLATALRETFEEVGISEDAIEPLGRFHDYISITGFRVTPFAGYIRAPFTVKPQAREVAEVIQVPIRVFRDPAVLRVEKHAWIDRHVNVYSYAYGTHQIWGLTAQIIKDFMEVLAIQ